MKRNREPLFGYESDLVAGSYVDRANRFTVRVDETWVTVDATLPNSIFEACLDRGLIPQFAGYSIAAREPPLPDEGRTDFRLLAPTSKAIHDRVAGKQEQGEGTDPVYVEVKSNTYVVDGVSKFSDRSSISARSQRTTARVPESALHTGPVARRSGRERSGSAALGPALAWPPAEIVRTTPPPS